MASAITDFGANYWLGVILGLESVPAHYWVAACSSEPGANADGDIVAALEPTDPTYHRVEISSGSSHFALNAGLATSLDTVTFPLPFQPWGQINHYALCDAEDGGNCYGYGVLANPLSPQPGQLFQLPIGGIALTLSQLLNSIAI